MLDGFESAETETRETTIFARRGGSGPPLLLLHFFPEAVPGKCAAAGRILFRPMSPTCACGLARLSP
jgi:hypothetical protein